MKYTALVFTLFTACSPGFATASQAALQDPQLVGQVVLVHLDDNAQQVAGTVISLNETGVLIRLQSTNKMYFYPLHRVSGVEQL